MNKYNEIATCISCGWEGEPSELITTIEENRVNNQDKTLYEIKHCPNCDGQIIEINEVKDEF